VSALKSTYKLPLLPVYHYQWKNPAKNRKLTRNMWFLNSRI